MFELGWIEIGLIGVIALVVLGPERLPKAARFAGLWVRKARAQWFAVKSELEREMGAEALKASLNAEREAIRDAVKQIDDEARQLRDGPGDGMPGAGDDGAPKPPSP
ncbi:MAG TPA: twin-arginine translocase subunit TatB [Xanthomonadaceae bacterium]|jgi:sec-independent protein translocase protein TatB|nr:twin-arginine translocase subunit TatB [Xanthomonadaceae bacterium]